MYQIEGNTVRINRRQWHEAGLSDTQLWNDSRNGKLRICGRGEDSCIEFDTDKIKYDRLKKLGLKISDDSKVSQERIFVDIDPDIRAFFDNYRKPNGQPLSLEEVLEHTNCASILKNIKEQKDSVENARKGFGVRKMPKGEMWRQMFELYTKSALEYNCRQFGNVRYFERVFKKYCKDGAKSLLSGKIGNDSTRVVSRRMENLFLALYRTTDKPFAEQVYEDYIAFVRGNVEIYDKETGEVFDPKEFRDKNGRPIEVSKTTVWNYLKKAINLTAIYEDRNGNFDYTDKMRPKNYRKRGQWTMSKITIDDVALSRRSVKGWVYKYQVTDVVSGYIFRPAYIIGKPTTETVKEALRNMFCQCLELGLPIGGQLDAEHHLIADMEWLGDVFPFVYFNPSAWSKRAEHTNKQLKYGVSKKNGHTRGRWYSRHEAYKSIRNKVKGDYLEPQYQPQTIVADDLSDIDEYNNQLHPQQKIYPGMTRRDVLLRFANPNIISAPRWRLYRYVGNMDYCTIYNNDYVKAANGEFELIDFESLKQLKPNNYKVEAYWLPEEDGSVEQVYLYQGDTYIGEAVNRRQYRYNENTIEQTDEDRANMLHQQKRAARFDKMIRDRRAEIGKVGKIKSETNTYISNIEADIVESEQPKGYEVTEEWTEDINYGSIAIEQL